MQDKAYDKQAVIHRINEAQIGASSPRNALCYHRINNVMKLLLEKVNVTFTTKLKNCSN